MKHKRTARKFIAVIMCVAFILSLTGCWDSTEINQLAIVMGLGIDKGSEEGNYIVTAQVAKVALLKTSEGTNIDPTNKAYLNRSKEGPGIDSALNGIMRLASRKLYTKNNQVIVINADLAKDGLYPILDYFIRSSDSRLSVPLIISRDSARDIFFEQVELEAMPAIHLRKAVDAQQWLSQAITCTVENFLSESFSLQAPSVPIIHLVGEEDTKSAQLAGTAIFKDAKMVGELDMEETKITLILRNKLTTGVLTISALGSFVSMDISQAQTKITSKYEAGKFSADIKVDLECKIINTGSGENIESPEIIELLEKVTASHVKAEMEALALKSKEMEADFLGIGDLIYRRNPKESKEMIKNWDKNFKNLPIRFDVSASIVSTGLSSKTINAGGIKNNEK